VGFSWRSVGFAMMDSPPPELPSSHKSPFAGSSPLIQALQDGFDIGWLPPNLRVGHTLTMRRLIKGLPSFEDGLEAYRNNRSVPLHEYRPITLECAEDVEVAIRHCTCHPSEALVPCQQKYAYNDCVAAAKTPKSLSWEKFDTATCELVNEAVLAERERCAKIAESFEVPETGGLYCGCPEEIAAAIRRNE
jgi:hypothetical protein